jgi:ATP-binding cassette subfamily C protein
MFYYSTRLALIGLLLIALAVVFVYLVCRSLFGSLRRTYTLKGELSGMVLQLMSGISKLRGAGAEMRAFGRWANVFSEQMQAQYSTRLTGIRQAVLSTVYPGLCTLVLFLTLGLFMKGEDPLSIGSFLAFNSAFGSFLAAVLSMSASVISLVGILFIHDRAVSILETSPEVDDARLFPGRLNGRIEVNQVSFRYDKEGPFTVENVSLQVQPGEFVAVVGPSGSGKSTMLRLLLGFETPELGSIYYDGQELSRLDIQSVRRQMGVVLQNGSILPGSIFQNIVGGAQLTMDDAWRAARLAGMEQDILEMPMQMHTVIMEGAGGFSGGQKQRLMIARAVAGNPRILFFDEATSALDNQTQDIVSRSISSLKATRIVIAHRLSTIIQADRIHVMVKGRVVQTGTYAELMARDGPFKELVARQIL